MTIGTDDPGSAQVREGMACGSWYERQWSTAPVKKSHHVPVRLHLLLLDWVQSTLFRRS